MSNVIHVNFKPSTDSDIIAVRSARYPYIRAWCQYIGYSRFVLYRLLQQATKDRPGRHALYPTSKGKWMKLHEFPDAETKDVLMDLVVLKGEDP